MARSHSHRKDGSGRHTGSAGAPEYKCGFPGCGKVVHERSLIDLHHIIPLSMGGSDLPFNRLWVCPDHHRRIFVPGCQHGQHAYKHLDSIIVMGYLNSSVGRILHFVDPFGIERFWSYRLEDTFWDKK